MAAATPDRVVAAAAELLDPRLDIVTPSAHVAALLQAAGRRAECRPLDRVADATAGAIALLADEVSVAGEHADGLVAAAVTALRPGGVIAVSAVSRLPQELAGRTEPRGYLAEELRRALGHHGVDVEVLCAPGAAGIVAGVADRPFDTQVDRRPGVLDVAPRLLAVGRTAPSPEARSAAFFSTLPYKIVAAGVLCTDDDNRLLVVHDSFKQHWTIPGGVVDADENPRDAAEREAWEEAGVRVTAGAVLGVFSASWPDRVVLVYEATPRSDVEHPHTPVHAHEIDGVEWWPLPTALRRLAPHIAEQVRHCLDHPGGSLRQRLA